jgi:hypothetical protein
VTSALPVRFEAEALLWTVDVALFQHELRHEGRAVTRGTKDALRTETVDAGDEPIGRAVFPPE